MTSQFRRDTFGDLRSTRLFEEGFSKPWRILGADQVDAFPLDLSETADEIAVTAALPGIKPEDLDISITNDGLMIRAQRREEAMTEGRSFHRRELIYGTIERSIALPIRVDADQAQATLENGLLRLTLPKLDSQKAKSIHVKPTGPAPLDLPDAPVETPTGGPSMGLA
jgi:HSP20 family protein